MQTYTPAKLGSKRVRTPEGFLLCKDVVFARTGELIYGAGEIPVKPGLDGRARVTRDESVVFAPATLNSMLGKSVTVRHPPTAVGSHDWRTVEAGTILSARRGGDYMIGDVIIKDASTVDMMDAASARGERIEVSLGYDATYKDDGGGRGRQTKITANHLALLPPGIRGRCGPECYVGDEDTCYIGDQAIDFEEPTMTDKTPAGVALLRKLFGAETKDEAVLLLDQAAAEEATNQLVTKLTKDVADLTAALAKLTKDSEKSKEKDGDEDEEDDKEKAKKKATADAAYVAANLTRVKSSAEILAPGTTFPTHDSADMTATRDAMCGCQRTALAKALDRPEGKHAVEAVFGAGVDLAKVDAVTLDAGFYAAAGLIGALNNHTLSAMAMARGEGGELASAQQRAIEADKRSRERWNKTA